ncbi:Hypothetical protein NTJ_04448 [Nesidiocoris tenuis]|uniref:Ribosomal protein mS38 C-terminal domain-containing protein n=1 Tax=Nesidiocoris tenuis TaxID=355587 RepID=A0ABN7AHA1_9HEMI|nr:Hypothetical protein NTJ_04448 [Nesidiocoris tenuis]
MTLRASFCRLARGIPLINPSSSLRCISTRTTIASTRGTFVPPINLKALNSRNDLVDPKLNSTFLNILDVPNVPLTVRTPGILDRLDVPWIWIPPPDRIPAPIENPTEVIEKQAARLIVIRRRKMRRHKLKKLRKRMKYEWAKKRQRRELKKEKAFQAELMAQIRESKKFDAAAYVAEKLRQANEVPLPKYWRGKRLPEFVIKDLLKEKQEKWLKIEARKQRRAQMPKKVSDFEV